LAANVCYLFAPINKVVLLPPRSAWRLRPDAATAAADTGSSSLAYSKPFRESQLLEAIAKLELETANVLRLKR